MGGVSTVCNNHRQMTLSLTHTFRQTTIRNALDDRSHTAQGSSSRRSLFGYASGLPLISGEPQPTTAVAFAIVKSKEKTGCTVVIDTVYMAQ